MLLVRLQILEGFRWAKFIFNKGQGIDRRLSAIGRAPMGHGEASVKDLTNLEIFRVIVIAMMPAAPSVLLVDGLGAAFFFNLHQRQMQVAVRSSGGGNQNTRSRGIGVLQCIERKFG